MNEITPATGRDFIVRDGIPMIRVRAENNKTRKFREWPLEDTATVDLDFGGYDFQWKLDEIGS